MVVDVRFEGDDDIETFLIGSREEAETASIESTRPPRRWQGPDRRARGRHVEYETPNGKTLKVTLVTAKPFAG